MTIFNAEFFLQDSVVITKELLGQELNFFNKKGIITELEIYHYHEPSAHSYKGKTKRNIAMFATGGTIYVYQMHKYFCMNIAIHDANVGNAILLRGLYNQEQQELYDGPGKMCNYLGVTKEHNGFTVVSNECFIKKVHNNNLIEIPYQTKLARKKSMNNSLYSQANTLYYYNTYRIGLNPKNTDYNLKNRYVIANYSTKPIKLL